MNKTSTVDNTIKQILEDEALPYKYYIQQIIEKNKTFFKPHQINEKMRKCPAFYVEDLYKSNCGFFSEVK